MKIALSAKGNNLKSPLDLRFGRCDQFLIYDLETEDLKIIDNKGKESSGGAGIAASQQLIDESVEVVITGNTGPNAYDLLSDSGIKIYKGREASCGELIESYKKGELPRIKEAGPAYHGGGR